jgi:hypothetical protein
MTRARAPLSFALALAITLLATLPAIPVLGARDVGVVSRSVHFALEEKRLVELPIVTTHVALHWSGNPHASVFVELSADGATFGPPLAVEHDEAGGHAGTETYGSVLWSDGARFARVTTDQRLGRLTIEAINARSSTSRLPSRSQTVAAAVDQPQVISRAGWGANETKRFDADGNELWPPDFSPIQKLTVHHTAGRNDDPDPEATVRAIYRYHAVTREWGDIGYNFLIDEAGRIYEGRYSRPYAATETPTGEDAAGNGVTAAHVGGYNSGTVGIALLGTLTDVDATPAARDALERLLAWKAERHGIDPRGGGVYTNPVSGVTKSVANISGHQDWAATECPGGVFYSTLPALRSSVYSRINGTEPPAATAPEAPVLSAARPPRGKGIKLTWTVPSDGGSSITGYRVRRLTNGTFQRIASLGASTTTYRDTSARRGRTYTYVVRAVNSVGLGPLSNEASAVAR